MDHLSSFPGYEAVIASGSQPKLLKSVVYLIFDRRYLSNYTWTGKSTKGQKKQALKDKPNVVKLVFEAINKLDASYKYSSYLNHLKNKVLKYAYE